jgi:L-fuculose-phosphate aldolase
MDTSSKAVINDLIQFGKNAGEKGLIWANSGNVSYRLNENGFIITGAGSYLGDLKLEDFVILDMENNILDGERNPSIESKMHSSIYRARSGAVCVFHSQAFFTTLLSCTTFKVNPNLFPESMAYLKKICRVRYNHPGSRELADEVSDKISNCDILILNNHGAICPGSSLSDVLLKTETLEMLCRMIVFSRVSEINLNFLPQDLKEDFLKHLKKIKDTR